MSVFSDIYENKSLCTALESDLASASLTHAYILEGPSGSGRHTILRDIFSTLAGAEFEHKIRKNLTPDIITVTNEDDRKTIGIDSIRAVKKEAVLTPNELEFKAFVIENADTMTAAAQNALLKLLEEPPNNVYIFLLCENSSLILPTVKSRAPILRMQLFTESELDAFISDEKQKNSNIKKIRVLREKDRPSYDSALKLSSGSIGGLYRAADRCRNAKDAAAVTLAADFAAAALHGDSVHLYSMQASMPQKRDEMITFLEYVKTALRDIAAIKYSPDASTPLLFLTDRTAAEDIAESTGLARITTLCDIVDRTVTELSRNINLNTAQICLIGRIAQ